MPAHGLDSRNLFDGNNSTSDGLVVGYSQSVVGDNSIAQVALGNASGSSCVIESRRVVDNQIEDWYPLGSNVTCSKQDAIKLWAGFEYRVVITTAGDGSAPVTARFTETSNANHAYGDKGTDSRSYAESNTGFAPCPADTSGDSAAAQAAADAAQAAADANFAALQAAIEAADAAAQANGQAAQAAAAQAAADAAALQAAIDAQTAADAVAAAAAQSAAAAASQAATDLLAAQAVADAAAAQAATDLLAAIQAADAAAQADADAAAIAQAATTQAISDASAQAATDAAAAATAAAAQTAATTAAAQAAQAAAAQAAADAAAIVAAIQAAQAAADADADAAALAAADAVQAAADAAALAYEVTTQEVCLSKTSGDTFSALAHYEYGFDANGEVELKEVKYTDAEGTQEYLPVIHFVGDPALGACAAVVAPVVATDTALTVITGTGNIPAGFKSVTITNVDDATTINGGHPIGYDTVISISFGTDRSDTVNELLPAYTLSGGSPYWIGHK